MGKHLSDIICRQRQALNMTQEEFALRLGVTPQAVSKWERQNGLPDITMIPGICSILGISANKLLGIDSKIVENENAATEKDVKGSLIAEPFVLEFGKDIVPCMMAGFETDYTYINTKRMELAGKTGMLMPLLRVRDNLALDANAFQITSYDKALYQETLENIGSGTYRDIINKAVHCCMENYAVIINKQLVKVMVDNLKERFPGVADGLIPERISYLQIKRQLQDKIKCGESIRDLIHIVEEMEAQLTA